MTNLSNKIAFISFYWMLMISVSSAHYCEWGLCDLSQYCCEDNTCCNAEQYNIFFIVALTLGISAIVIASCICLYCNLRIIQTILPPRYFGITYVIMKSSSNSQAQPATSEISVREKNQDGCII
ncbi:hypothetical protein KPH14_001797 [Odynerus spinipes]|uniref:Uncharacterized protein n=1 Tax=Odynerus spinipes TaxID=1348599 RepID=A0AAD9RZT6_9HYME|nr:hypothetical protein KPH14_001797 [Odynerus spinipes]